MIASFMAISADSAQSISQRYEAKKATVTALKSSETTMIRREASKIRRAFPKGFALSM